ncbi:hypothetical protein BC567DRAFT_262466 [Phyllosticta citribraziliensis]
MEHPRPEQTEAVRIYNRNQVVDAVTDGHMQRSGNPDFSITAGSNHDRPQPFRRGRPAPPTLCSLLSAKGVDVWFGGLGVLLVGLLVGDFVQLLPIGGSPLFTSNPEHQVERLSRAAYEQFAVQVRLTEPMRQQGAAQEAFHRALGGLRDHSLTREDFNTLASRVSIQPTPSDVLRLYSQKDVVDGYNEMLMRRCDKPVITIRAFHPARDRLAASASFDQAGRLKEDFGTLASRVATQPTPSDVLRLCSQKDVVDAFNETLMRRCNKRSRNPVLSINALHSAAITTANLNFLRRQEISPTI